jgi:hypothetical protein
VDLGRSHLPQCPGGGGQGGTGGRDVVDDQQPAAVEPAAGVEAGVGQPAGPAEVGLGRAGSAP